MSREDELPFRADFTERVLEAADRISLRRRRTRRAAVAAAVVLLAGAGALRFVPMRMPATDDSPHLVAGFDTAAADDTQAELTDYMFPEAADLTQFSEEYAGAADDDQALFAEDGDDSGS